MTKVSDTASYYYLKIAQKIRCYNVDPQALSLNRCFYQNNLSISYIHVPVIYQTTNIVTFLFSTLHGRNMVITIKSSILHSEYNPFII